jgi:putrescine aminotransferase
METSALAQYLVPQFDELMGALPAIFVMRTLLEEYGVYTQVTRSNPNVLRVQPPLILTEQDANRFLEAVAETVVEFAFMEHVVEAVLTKSIGDHHAVAPATGAQILR